MSTVTAVTPEQYLDAERQAEYKSEYFDGEVVPMAGASGNHGRLAHVASLDLGNQLWDSDCEIFQADLKVACKTNGSYCYPDIVVVCGKPEWLDDEHDTLLNPTVIIEVLSPSTERNDRGRKFEGYRGIASLRQYLMLNSQRVSAELYTKESERKWVLTSTDRLEDTVELESIGCQLSLARLYRKVDISRQSASETPARS